MSEKKRGGGGPAQRPKKSSKPVKPAPKAAVAKASKGRPAPPRPPAPGHAERPSPAAAPPARGGATSPKGTSAECLEPGCRSLATARGYCRLHYIKNWKVLKSREQRAVRRQRSEFDDALLHRVPVDYEDRVDRVRPAPRRTLDLEISRAREDVEEMFREMGFEDEI